jgi:hypothetical protein
MANTDSPDTGSCHRNILGTPGGTEPPFTPTDTACVGVDAQAASQMHAHGCRRTATQRERERMERERRERTESI